MSNILPNDLIENLKSDPNFDSEAFIAIHSTEERTNSVRLNPLKSSAIEKMDFESNIPWCKEGRYLVDRPVFTLDPYFHSGCYYSQEASSMFLDYAIRQLKLDSAPIRALDLCAAPGGKSTLLNSSLHADSLLVSNEIIKSRVNVLMDNLIRWGYPNVVVTNNDPSAFAHLPGYFDLMVVDAPCSGSGMFHKDHSAIDEWSLANVKLCSERQKRILGSSVQSLAEGGCLFYSTCSYSREENEAIVEWLIQEHEMEVKPFEIDEGWGIEETYLNENVHGGYRFYPHKVRGEGFFFAALRKKAPQNGFSLKKVKMDKNSAPQDIAKAWMDTTDLYTFLHQDNLHVFPKRYEQDLKALKNVLYLKNAGTMIGKFTGKELLPSHDLALSVRVRKDIPGINLDLNTTLSYLRKETLDPSYNTLGINGWLLIQYNGVNVGWIKAMPNRINNYYPKELRIANL